MMFPFESKEAPGVREELKIKTSSPSKPMMTRYNASVTASRSMREVRVCRCEIVAW